MRHIVFALALFAFVVPATAAPIGSAVPKYMTIGDKGSWIISAIFAPFTTAMAVVGTIVDPSEKKVHTRQLRRTAAIMTRHAGTGEVPKPKGRKYIEVCYSTGNWVNAPVVCK
jgi:nucleoside permease NupC